MSDYEHFILTRFNVRIPYRDSAVRPEMTDKWINRRFELFTQYCVPGVSQQTCRDFRWLVYFDTHTSINHRRRIDAVRQTFPFEPVYIDLLDPQTVTETVRSRISPGCEYVISSRLDSDDVLGSTYIRDVQSVFDRQEFEFVDFPRGYKIENGKLYHAYWKNNIFASLIERSCHPRTVTVFPFYEIEEYGPVRRFPQRIWLQVLHDSNCGTISTGGWRIRSTSCTEQFGSLLRLSPERSYELALDNTHYLLSRLAGRYWYRLKKRLGLLRSFPKA